MHEIEVSEKAGGQSPRTLNVMKSESEGKGNRLERFGEKYVLTPHPAFSLWVSKILSPSWLPWLYSTLGPWFMLH